MPRKRRDKSATPPSRRAHPHLVAPMPFYPGYPWMQWPGMYMPRPPFIPVPCRSHAVERSKEEARKDRRERRGKKVGRKARRDSRAKKSRKRRKASGSGSSSSISSSTSGSASAQRPKKVAHTEQKASKLKSAKDPPDSKMQEPKLSRRGKPEIWTCSKCDEQNKWERARCNNCYASRPAPQKAQHRGLELPGDKQEVGSVAHATVLASGLCAFGGPSIDSDVVVGSNRPLVTCRDDDEEEDEEEEAYQQAVRAAFDRSMIAPHEKSLPKDSCKTSPRVILQVGRSNTSSAQKANAYKEQGSTPVSMSREKPPASASSALRESSETSQKVQESLREEPRASASSSLRENYETPQLPQESLKEKAPASPLSSVSEEVQVVHEELESWLTSLDGGRGGMLQYLPALAKFSTNLMDIAAVRERPPDSGQSIVDVIRPTFWNDIGVSKQGHKLVIARGLAQLAEKL